MYRTSMSHPDRANAGSGSGGGGLVKDLLFPAYADAGAGDQFSSVIGEQEQQQDASEKQQENQHASTSSSEAGGGGAQYCGSEASTAVRDNRSFHLTHPPTKQTLQQSAAAAAAAPAPPSFFASTKPSSGGGSGGGSSSTTQQREQQDDNNSLPPVPASPPKVPRIPLPLSSDERSVSNTAVVASSGSSLILGHDGVKVNMNAPVPDDNVFEATETTTITTTTTKELSPPPPDAASEKSQETVYQETSGIAILPAETTPRRVNRRADVVDHSASSSRSSSSFSDENQAQNRSILDLSQSDHSKGTTSNEWEEEATPAQTAFGKHLLFQRQLLRKRDSCDSTASEQGTVINHAQRMAEMDDDLQYNREQQQQLLQDDNLQSVESSTTNSTLYETPPQEDVLLWNQDKNNLALPVLESTAATTCTNTSSPPVGRIRRPEQHAVESTTKAVVGSPTIDLRSPIRIHRTKRLNDDGNDYDGIAGDGVGADADDNDYCAGHEEKKLSDTIADAAVVNPPNQRSNGILSMAIRRLGSGFTNNNNNNNSGNGSGGGNHLRSSLSAPTTPQPYRNKHFSASEQDQQHLLFASPPRSSSSSHFNDDQHGGLTNSPSQPRRQQQQYLPSSFLLRSPGSSAFQQAASAKKSQSNNDNCRPRLAPKVSNWNGSAHRLFDKIPENEVAGRSCDNQLLLRSASNSNNTNMKAFQIARSCFSFDAFDTSMDEQYEFSVPNDHHYFAGPGSQQQQQQHPKSPRRNVHREEKTVIVTEDSSLLENRPQQQPQQQQHLTSSASWDAAGAHIGRQQKHVAAAAAAAFRPRHVAGLSTRVLRPPPSTNSSSSIIHTNNLSPRRADRSRSRMLSDYSPSSAVMSPSETRNLKTPQRIEIEREDALDILACLVERGVSWKTEPLVHDCGADRHGADDGSEDGRETGTKARENLDGDDRSSGNQTPSISEITSIVRELEELSLAEENLGDFHDNSETFKKRKRALEELLRSHEYALEMKRASQSASSWLQSIGRSHSIGGSPSKPTTTQEESEHAVSADSPGKSEQAAGEESSASESMDLLTVKAMLHSSQMEVKEMTDVTERLNEELAKCRAEIGRLKTAAQASVYRSPNRSILDESDDISVTEGDDEEEEIDVLERSFESVASVGNKDLDTSFLNQGDDDDDDDKTELRKTLDAATELAQYKAALQHANTMIQKLHSSLKSHGFDDETTEETPLISVPFSDEAKGVQTHKESPGKKGEGTGIVKMLQGENFVTDWNDLSPSMPGPPEHELRSPIVASILESWTSDRTLHESLVAWMDQILKGGDPETIPPLTLSSLDHQVRDGFTLHVLPLLFRRPDIRVDIKCRAHRRTAYDISVSVESLAARENPQGSSAAHVSAATTALVNNSAGAAETFHPKDFNGVVSTSSNEASSRLSYDEMTEDIGSLDDTQPGLMSTLGGALGGLLTRRKGPNQESLPPEGPPSNMEMILESPSSTGLVSEIVGLAEGDDDQPYHRVVSAPPGRIGVTFVEYRGHCMVSDVNPDSPLIGWIFPSDVLIAIDELPVSGMRVRDIIKVLRDRSDRQRAMRVVSSHAMNEFTLNTTSEVSEAG